MNNNDIKSYMHVALVLDASGSMSSLKKTTVESLKKFFESLASKDDKTLLDVWQFDDEVEHLISYADLNDGAPQTIERYKIGGCTALYDAICIGIDELGAKFAAMKEEDRPDGIVFAILTDGYENASKRFTVKDVQERIKHQSEKYSWQFKFLAANQDAVLAGKMFGLDAKDCDSWVASEEGVKAMCDDGSFLMACCADIRSISRSKRATKNYK